MKQNWQKGRVQWFDKTSGEGVVVGENGESYYVHYSTIVPKSLQTKTTAKKGGRRNLDSGCDVRFKLYENLYSKRIEKVQQI